MSDIERLTAEAYRAWLAKHNMDHKGAAAFFGVSSTTTMRWELGLSPIPYILARVVHYMERLGESPGPEYEMRKREPKRTASNLDLQIMVPLWQKSMDEKAEKAKRDAEAMAEAEEWQKRLNPAKK